MRVYRFLSLRADDLQPLRRQGPLRCAPHLSGGGRVQAVQGCAASPSPSADLESVKRVALGPKGVPYVSLHDGRTIRYPDPSIRVNDSVKIILPTRADGGAAAAKGAAAAPATAVGTSSATIEDIIPFQTGALATVTGGRNMVSVLATPIQLTRAGPDWHDRLARPPPGFVSRC